MSRPTKQGLEYFPHDVDSSSDPKLEALQLIYGFEGYAFFFKMLECIYATENCEIDISDTETREETLQILAKKTAETRQKFDKMFEISLRHGVFNKELYLKGLIVSNGAKKRAKVVLEKRVAGRTKYNSTHKSKDESKDKDKGKDLEGFRYGVSDAETIPEINNPSFYEINNFGKLDANAADKITDAEKEYSVIYVSQAMWVAVKNKKLNWPEVTRILEYSRRVKLSPLEVFNRGNGRTPKESDDLIKTAMDEYEKIQGYAFLFKNEGEKDYVLFKRAVSGRYSVSDILECKKALDQTEYWQSKGMDAPLSVVVDNLGKYKSGKLQKPEIKKPATTVPLCQPRTMSLEEEAAVVKRWHDEEDRKYRKPTAEQK